MSNSAEQMSLWKYVKRTSDSASSSSSNAEGSTATSTTDEGENSQRGDDDGDSDSLPLSSLTKRAKTVSSNDCKLSPNEIDAILTAEVPDLGLFPIVKIRNSAAMHDRLKEKLLKSRFEPSKTWVAPKRQCGPNKRCVSSDFFNPQLYPCIRYSVTKDGLLCIACVLFGCQKIILTTEPLTDWSNAKRLILKHEKTGDHKFFQQKSIDFLQICDKQQLGIPQHMTRVHYEILQHNTKVLHAIVSLIATCGRQNVSIRGKMDDRSNFMAFLFYRAEGDPDLQQHLRSCPKNARYTSHRIQNELINLCGNQIRNKIIALVKASGMFTVLADETADISCT